MELALAALTTALLSGPTLCGDRPLSIFAIIWVIGRNQMTLILKRTGSSLSDCRRGFRYIQHRDDGK